VVKKRRSLPEVNELVIGTVKKIFEHGAFITLDEYGGLEAYIPLNEVSHTWFRSIREVLKIGQKRVFKVIRVNLAKKQVDVSLRRVAPSERRAKIYEWKRANRAEKLLELAAEKLGKTLDDAYREVGWKLEDYYGEIFAGLEETSLRGKEALVEAGVAEPWASVVKQLAKAYIKIPRVKISGVFSIQCLQSDGVIRLKEILLSWKGLEKKYDNVRVRAFVVGPPRYRVDVEALDYKTAETLLKDIVNTVTKVAAEKECSAVFERLR